MASCTFFGHRDCPESIRASLIKEIERLICDQQVESFYVGTQGSFDRMAYSALKKLCNKYSNIKVYRVLAYMPRNDAVSRDNTEGEDTILPEGIERVHPRYAIVWRNNWMIDHSEYVIAYITHPTGGAYRAVERAKKKGRPVILIEY